MEKFALTKRGGLYSQGETDVISVYTNEKIIIVSLETFYPENYDSDEESIVTNITWYKEKKHIDDLCNTVDWLNANRSCVKKNNDNTYNLISFMWGKNDIFDLEIYEDSDPFKRDYYFNLNKIRFVHKNTESPYNGPLKKYEENSDDDSDETSSEEDSD